MASATLIFACSTRISRWIVRGLSACDDPWHSAGSGMLLSHSVKDAAAASCEAAPATLQGGDVPVDMECPLTWMAALAVVGVLWSSVAYVKSLLVQLWYNCRTTFT